MDPSAAQVLAASAKFCNVLYESITRWTAVSIRPHSNLEVPKQHISEVLNQELKSNFNEFINSYRIESFIEYLKLKEYKNFTLFGIAQEAGFKSKTTFNSSFKKIKGLTPSEFRKAL